MKHPKYLLPIIVISQFCCTSLWFAGNGVMDNLVMDFELNNTAFGVLTSAVQFGFILGTLMYAFLTIVDRFSPSKVFFLSGLFAAIANAALVLESNTLTSLLSLRFFTGFFLAGVYPVGMKIASDYYNKGLGKSLGFLVGALVVGTAFPHLLKAYMGGVDWTYVIFSTSGLAILGASLLLFFIPDGPYRTIGQPLKINAIWSIFKNQKFKSAACGYFGHMWELYAFWAFVPFILQSYLNTHPETTFNIPVLSFIIIAIGGLACVFGAYLAEHFGLKKIAVIALLSSGVAALLSPLFFFYGSENVFIVFLLFWGIMVIADSPLLSTLVAKNAPSAYRGTALTLVNCIGFAITIISIQLLTKFSLLIDIRCIYIILALGPVLGSYMLLKKQ